MGPHASPEAADYINLHTFSRRSDWRRREAAKTIILGQNGQKNCHVWGLSLGLLFYLSQNPYHLIKGQVHFSALGTNQTGHNITFRIANVE